MNKVYRLVWNAALGTWVCAAETARGRGKSRSGRSKAVAASVMVLALAGQDLTLAAEPAANALPTGGQVVAGQAQISQQGSATLNIQQSTQRAAIDWQSFNIGSKAAVNFQQPNAQSVTLNRVLSSDPSQIFGTLRSNGQIFLSNPNGVYFAPGASVDVGGLLATTGRISNADFMAGRDTFTMDAAGSVLNAGRLAAAPGGYIALLAPEVRNEGVIVANAGTVALGAGESITLDFGNDSKLAGNYVLTPPASTTADIAPITLSVIGAVPTAFDKVYDGTTAVNVDVSGVTLGGVLAGDTLAVSASGTTADKNAGVDKLVSIVGLLTGADAGNYALPGSFPTSGLITITPATLALSGFTAQGKTYDGSAAATLDTSGVAYTGLVSGDAIGYTASGAFNDKNAGIGKAVNISAALTGADAGNYILTPPASTTADIAPITLSVIGAVPTAFGKVYDGTTAVTVDVSGVTLGGVLAGDTLAVSASGTTADKNAGVDKLVSIVGLLTGADAGNYALPGSFPTSGLITITPATLALSGFAAQGKTYDGTTAATLITSGVGYTGLLAGDAIGYTASAAFTDPNAGTGKTVNISAALTGADAGNYVLTPPASTTADIAKRTLVIDGLPGGGSGGGGTGGGTSFTKTYDGTTAVPINTSGVTIGGLLPGEQVGVTASGSTADPNAGVDKTVNLSYGLTGANAGNYDLPAGLPATGRVTIAPQALTVTARDFAVLFTGQPFAGGNGVDFAGFIAGESSSVLGGTLGYGGSAQGATAPGQYQITPQGLTSGNYAISFLSGVLTVLGAAEPPVPQPPVQPPPGSSGGGGGTDVIGGNVGSGNPGGIGSGQSGGLVDLSPPGGNAVEVRARSADATGQETNNEVTVTLVRQPELTLDGFVTVMVPHDTATSGAGFNFALPPDSVQGIPVGVTPEMRLANGGDMPSWLKYDPEKRAFVAGAVPDGALPLQVVLTHGRVRTVVVISERPR